VTVRDLLASSLRLIGAIEPGESPTAQQQADALQVFKGMLDTWSTENLLIPAKAKESFSLIASTENYTIGDGGTFDTDRPVKIEHAAIKDTDADTALEIPVKILTFDEWANIRVKEVTSSFPTSLYYEPTNPLGNIHVWPVPSAAYQLMLYFWKSLSSFSGVDSTFDMQPGYAEMAKYNLASRLAPEFGTEASPTVISLANDLKAKIKISNSSPKFMAVDPAFMSRQRTFNWITGE